MSDRLFPDDAPNYVSACFPPPRAFQDTAHESLRQGAREGHRCQVVMAPTGAGKSYLGLRVAHEALLRGKKAVFVCDRTTLINQTSEAADRYGLSAHGILQADHWRADKSMPFQIASAQTIARRGWPEADVIIVDECHTQMASWVNHMDKTDAKFIGLSATPFSRGLGKLFTRLVNAATMHELTELKVLVPMRVLSCTRPDMAGAKLNSKGEWAEEEAAARGMGIIGDVVSEWISHGQGRKTICFGSTIAHCEELCAQFNAAGVMAACFTSDTDPFERSILLAEYKKDDSPLKVLISVEALAKGFDVPTVACVIDCRPLRKSLSLAIQMWGRGLRSSPETGKKDCILLDHSGNIVRFKDDFERIYFDGLDALDAGEKLDSAVREDGDEDEEAKGCPACGHKPFSRRCMACGHENQRAALVVAEAGEMREVVMLGGKQMGENRQHVWAQVAAYARSHGDPAKAEGRAYYLFKDLTGGFPPTTWRVSSTPGVEITKAVMNHIQHRNIAFREAMKKKQREPA